MRRKLAIGALGLMVVLATAVVMWSQEGGPKGPVPGQGQHQFGGEMPRQWGGGPHKFAQGGRDQFGSGEEGRMGWHRHGEFGFGGGEHLLRMADSPRVRQYLGLSDTQAASLHKIGVDAEKDAVENRAAMEIEHIQLRELLRVDNPDRDAVMQELDRINALRGKVAKQRMEAFFAARGVLTPEQIQKIKTFMENRGFEGGRERGRMMGRREGPAWSHREGPGAPSSRPPAPPKQ